MTGSLSCALPAARLLLGEAERTPAVYEAYAGGVEALAQRVQEADGPARVRDSQGHFRDLYFPLAVHLQLSAWLECGKALAALKQQQHWSLLPGLLRPLLSEAAPPQGQATERGPYRLWQGLCLLEYAALIQRDEPAETAYRLIDRALRGPGEHGALHPRAEEETLDWWTFHELAGLHALADLLAIERQPQWQRRMREAVAYHIEHTQPDNATAHPWGVAAFFDTSDGLMFVEQQLHDVTTHSSQHETRAALLPGLLLADASQPLRGHKF